MFLKLGRRQRQLIARHGQSKAQHLFRDFSKYIIYVLLCSKELVVLLRKHRARLYKEPFSCVKLQSANFHSVQPLQVSFCKSDFQFLSDTRNPYLVCV